VCAYALSLSLCWRLDEGKSRTCVCNDQDLDMFRNMIFSRMHTHKQMERFFRANHVGEDKKNE